MAMNISNVCVTNGTFQLQVAENIAVKIEQYLRELASERAVTALYGREILIWVPIGCGKCRLSRTAEVMRSNSFDGGGDMD